VDYTAAMTQAPLPGPDFTPDIPDTPAPSHTAGLYCWIIGGLTALLFSCCGCGIGAIAALPTSEVQRLFNEQAAKSGNNLSQEEISQVLQLHPTGFTVLAIVVVVIGLVPALALIGLGFAVRQRKRPAVIAAMVILAGQTLFCGLMLFSALLNGLVGGDPIGALVSLVVFGGFTVLLIVALRSLWNTLSDSRQPLAPETLAGDTEPWDETDW